MMAALEKSRAFIITYDDGESTQSLNVPHDVFNDCPDFRKYILQMKCLHCNFESKFEEDKK